MGFLFLILYPAASASSRRLRLPVTCHTQTFTQTIFHAHTHTHTHTRTTLSHTHTIFTQNFVTHNSTLQHMIFHTATLSHTHNFSHTTLWHTQSSTRNFVTHIVTHTQLCRTRLCHTHTALSHAIFYTQLCHTQLCHTHNLSHTQLSDTHTQSLTRTIVHTHNLVTHTHNLCRTSCVAGAALGDIDLRFAWQVWLLATATFFVLLVAGMAFGDIHANTQTFTQTSFVHTSFTHKPEHTQTHTHTQHDKSEHTNFYTFLFHAQPFTHTHTLLSLAKCHTHTSFTKFFTQNSFTRNSFTQCLSHRALSHRALSHTTLSRTQHFLVTHSTITRTSLSHTALSRTVLSRNLSSTISYFFPHPSFTPVLGLLEEVDVWGFPVVYDFIRLMFQRYDCMTPKTSGGFAGPNWKQFQVLVWMMTSVVNGFENRRPITYELSCMIYIFFICVLWILNVQHISPMVAVRCLPRQQGATELSFDTKRGGVVRGPTHPSAAEGPKDLGSLPGVPCMFQVQFIWFVAVNVKSIKPVYYLLRSLVDNAETQAMTAPELGLCDDDMKPIWYSAFTCTCQSSSVFWRIPLLWVIHLLLRKASGSLPEDSASVGPEASESEPETCDEEVRARVFRCNLNSLSVS